MKKIFLTIAVALCGIVCSAQLREPIDTVMAPDSAVIILMSDKTW